MDRLKHWVRKGAMLVLVSLLAMALAYSFPADLALLFAADFSVYIEVMVTAFVVAQVARVKPMVGLARLWLSAAYGRIRGRTAARRQVSNGKKAANDDEDGAFLLAA